MARRRTSRTPTAEVKTAKAAKATRTPKAPATVAPEASVAPEATVAPEVEVTKLDSLKQNLVTAENAVKDAKVEVAGAKKAHAAAKKARNVEDDDSILAEARAQQAVPNAEKAFTKAEKAVTSVKERIVKEKAKQKSVEETATKDMKFLASVKPQIKEITTRLDKALFAEDKADDMRLSAAHIMATVEAQFTENKPKMKFRVWCETNDICTDAKGRSWENLRKLLTVGKSDDPVAALEDMRSANAAANKRARDKAASESSGEGSGKGSGSGSSSSRTVVGPVEAVREIVKRLVAKDDFDSLVEIADLVADAIESGEAPCAPAEVAPEPEAEPEGGWQAPGSKLKAGKSKGYVAPDPDFDGDASEALPEFLRRGQ